MSPLLLLVPPQIETNLPTFRPTPVSKALERALKSEALRTRAAFRFESKSVTDGRPWTMSIKGVKHLESPRAASGILEIYTYTGGAHGMMAYLTKNYRLDDRARPIPVTLASLFTADPYGQAEIAVLQKVRTNENAMWVREGSVGTLTRAQLDRFTLEPGGGLTFHFGPYELGPYAVGSFEVSLTPAELGPAYRGLR